MDKAFWQRKWENGDIGFHEKDGNALLARHLGRLDLQPGARIFLPLCGKTGDIGYLLRQGFSIAGAELSALAVEQLFAQLGLVPRIRDAGGLRHYSAADIDIYVGDIFDLDGPTLEPVDAIYDRAALVAMPADVRARYAGHLVRITSGAPQLLICFEYAQALMDGPPFAVGQAQLSDYYQLHYRLTLLGKADVAGGLKGKVAATETAWLLR